MAEAVAVPAWVLIAYLIAGICFIVALRGLSSPVSSQRGNRFGMAGMTIAVVTTLVTHVPTIDVIISELTGIEILRERRIDWLTASEILAAIAVGAIIGLATARRIQMTAMPQLVAGLDSPRSARMKQMPAIR